MVTNKVKVSVSAIAMLQIPSLGFLHTVSISLRRDFEQFIVNPSDGSISSLGSYKDSSFPDPSIYLKLQNFTPNYVYQHVYDKFHDHVFSRHITNHIVMESQRRDLPQQPLFMMVSVKFTKKEFMVVPSNFADLDKESVVESEDLVMETCAICLEDMSESETKPICQLPRCDHLFHEDCFIKWLDRRNSCPLCRKPVYIED